jgi:hypothetical protein
MKRSHLRAAGLFGTAALFLFVPLGCAKSPSGVSASGPQLIITMTVAGQIDPTQYHYYVLFNNSNDTTGSVGPIPVVSEPWGNGFATGSGTNGAGLTSYVVYDNSQNSAQGGFGAYTAVPGSDARTFQYVGAPLQTSVTSNTIQFRIPLSYLATTAVPTANITSLQINFLTTNVVPVNSNDNTIQKYFDALGDSNDISSVNDYITIPTTTSGIYQNSDKNIEPSFDDVAQAGNGNLANVNLPPIDIVNWSVEVRD